ncbi:hypothetical protein CNBK1170 [Cryptococcus deneoformans B-3501A]|uniref:Nucleus protein, putative n=1 Tax=Cryptococcus deneoformans (strain JEC21 / ATCC MYA-565) TaxID=214684 RepID=Q5K9D0_CRYD1|nr:nucleus protein, putative [Cryptococcus neoformans var. neoformans JEC21]XP_772743.1 hypothetical protein CNBK1170 [Cryptococcus neoformans var. neoformans B-3501A]AAW46194.2 nucleus protein, putative [Cryptococcus neoformans var. neoformans JEC21]EAL18096.1 hypothetical protein CNBK1170 [Cryptococcus neoformans var. neoformans B-3501A]
MSEVTETPVPPLSNVTEPPRSPNPLNPATDAQGENIQPLAEREPQNDVPGVTAAPDQPPLPVDAPLPPSPAASDEPPPSLPSSAIPTAVPTPTVITVGEDKPEVPAGAPLSTVTQGSASMDLDEATPQPVKRAGEELDGEREEKRLKEDGPAVEAAAEAGEATGEAIAVAVQSDVPLVGPDGQPLPPPAWLSYVPPAPKFAGPNTPLTLTQHKYMLNAVRSLKKRLPDAYNFLVPVDTVRFNIPHYHTVIDTPMDLGTVETKLIVSDPRGPPKDKSKMSKWDTSKGKYNNVAEVTEDVRRIWENSRKFNGKEHPVSQMATRLEEAFERSLSNLPAEPVIASPASAGPSHVRRSSISQPPVVRRSSDDTRPKREIHPPPPKDLAYEESPGSARKPKRRNDPQLQWASRAIKSLEISNKYYVAVSPFLYPVDKIIEEVPDYATVIKRPIDFNIIKNKLAENTYEDVNQVDDDIRLMVANAQKFNPPGHEVHTSATQLLQIWEEKWRTVPAKVETRDSSEDPMAEAFDDYSSDEDNAQLRSLESQVIALNQQISALRSKMTKRRAARGSKSKSKPKTAPRKSSVSKPSPNINGNSQPKKSKKAPKEANLMYREDDDESEEEEDISHLSHAQKQELAEKIGQTDGETLSKVISIIQQSTNIGGSNQEIELDIDSLPPATVIRLYNLVCRGGRGSGSKRGRGGVVKKAGGTGRKAMGGVSRRSVNEREEAERIRRMEQQLQAFESSRPVPQAVGYEEEESSSEEESSEEE